MMGECAVLEDPLCLYVDAVTVVLYNTMKSLSEMDEIPVSQVRNFHKFFIIFVSYNFNNYVWIVGNGKS